MRRDASRGPRLARDLSTRVACDKLGLGGFGDGGDVRADVIRPGEVDPQGVGIMAFLAGLAAIVVRENGEKAGFELFRVHRGLGGRGRTHFERAGEFFRFEFGVEPSGSLAEFVPHKPAAGVESGIVKLGPEVVPGRGIKL